MKEEIEAKFLNVDFADLRQRLTGLGAVCEQPMRLMRRVIMDYPDRRLHHEGAYIRVRDEGDKKTLTYKRFDKTRELHVASAQELETTIGSLEDTVALLQNLGMEIRSEQESRRETWKLGKVEVVLDEWPWLNPYIEIEGESEQALQRVATDLGFGWQDAVFGDVMVAYRHQYPKLSKGQSIGNLPQVRFGDPPPTYFKD